MKTILVIIMIAALPVLVRGQEPGTISADNSSVKRSLAIAHEMVRVIKALPDSFRTYKGDFVMKDETGNNFYKSGDTDLVTDQQFVEVKQSGEVQFVATWKKKDKDDRSPVLAFAAFTGGILNETDGQGYAVSNPVTDSTTAAMTYYLKAPGTTGAIIASMKFNPIFKESTFIVGEYMDRK